MRHIRHYRELTQNGLSELSGIDRGFISTIENGRSMPSLETIQRLAKALDVSFSELFKFNLSEPTIPYDGK